MNSQLQEFNKFGQALAQIELDHKTLENQRAVESDTEMELILAQKEFEEARDDLHTLDISAYSKAFYAVVIIALIVAVII